MAHRRQEVSARHPEIAALQERYRAVLAEQEQIREAVVAELVQQRLELPELPEAMEPEGLDQEPLYDSERDYLTQCAAYQA